MESHNPQGLVSRKLLRFHNVDLMAALGSFQLFKPFNGKSYSVKSVTVISRKIAGTISTQPQFKITDGTNDIVAAAANANANTLRLKALTVVTDRPASYAAPLTLTTTVQGVGTGSPVFLVDLIIEGFLY